MMLTSFIVVLLLAAFVSWTAARWSTMVSRLICLFALGLNLCLTVFLLFQHRANPLSLDFVYPWVSVLGLSFSLFLDGLSLLFLMLTFAVGAIAVLSSWSEVKERVGFFHLNLMLVLTGVTGVFLASNLVLFYVFWELMLVPMYLLILIWGHENRVYAANKFFVFTQVGSLFFLVAILWEGHNYYAMTGSLSFDVANLVVIHNQPSMGFLIMLGFLAAFMVKVPMFPLHPWLPDAHSEAPTGGSVVLAGLLLKTGCYGIIRFVIPLFATEFVSITQPVMILAICGIIYGAVMAFAQNDIKRLVAYTSVSHLGFVLLGIFSGTEIGLQGAVLQIICHGFSTGGLFMIAGMLKERLHTREIGKMGGIWSSAPRLSGFMLFFVFASIGLPGLGNFVGEFLVILATYSQSRAMAGFAAFGLVLASLYGLGLARRVLFGKGDLTSMRDTGVREITLSSIMVLALVLLGIFPNSVIDTAKDSVSQLVKTLAKVGSR